MVLVVETVLGVGMLAVGALGYRHAHGLSRFSEQIDAIGSTTNWDEVEPAGWKVHLYRVSFVLLAGLGGLFVLGGVLK